MKIAISRTRGRVGQIIAGAALLASPLALPAAQVEIVWNGGTGNWNVAGNWTPAAIPNNAADTYLVRVDGGKVGNSFLSLNQNATVDGVTVDAGDTLQINNNQSLSIATNSVANNGTWRLNQTSASGLTRLQFLAPVTLQGSGEWVLSNSTLNRFGPFGGLTTLNPAATIRGAGVIEMGANTFVNQGLIRQEGSNSLTIQNGAGGFQNTGELEAFGAGGLLLTGGVFTNTGGSITALDGSFVRVGPTASIINGELATAGTGQIRASGNGDTTPLVQDVELNGTYLQPTFQNTRIRGTITNNGIWSINHTSASSTSDLLPEQNAIMTGTGQILMGTLTFARIVLDGSSFTQEADHSIIGTGQIIATDGNIINRGLIRHTGGGNSLTVTMGAGTLTNEATIESIDGTSATSVNVLILRQGNYTNTASGLIQATDTGVVQLGPTASFSGGTLGTSGQGLLRINSVSGTGDLMPILSNLALEGNLLQPVNQSAVLRGNLTNNGLWTVNHTFASGNANLYVEQNALLTGSGDIVLSGNGRSRILTDNSTTTNDTDHSILGTGQIIVADGGMLVNKGLVRQEGNVPLTVNTGTGSIKNESTMEASGSGRLIFTNANVDNDGGLIRALDQRAVQFGPTATLTNGAIQSIDTGFIDINSSFAVSGSQVPVFEDVLSNASITQVSGQSAEIRGTFTNNGQWTTNHTSASASSNIYAVQGAILTGTGNVFMSGNTLGRFVTDESTINHESAHTLRGGGLIRVGDDGTLVNKGMIRQEGTTPLTVTTGTGNLKNEGTMEVAGSGRVILNNARVENASGLLRALDTRVFQVGPTALVRNGTLQAVDTGVFEINSASSQSGASLPVLEDLLISTPIAHPNNQSAVIRGTVINSGLWTSNHTSGSGGSNVIAEGAAILTGSGAIFMSGNAFGRFITDGTLVTHEAGHTIRGGGALLNGTGGMINRGTIRQEGATPLTVTPNDLGLVNEGLLASNGTGRIILTNGPIVNTDGVIEALDGGVVQIGPSGSITGGLITRSGNGEIAITGDNATSPLAVDVTFSGIVSQITNQDIRVRGTVTNNALWTVVHTFGSGNADVVLEQGATLAGSGEIFFNGNTLARIISDGTTVTNEAGHTIRGRGQIMDNTGGFINRGTVQADGVALTLSANASGFLNEGTLVAPASSSLIIANGSNFTNDGNTVVETGGNLTVTTGNYLQTGGETRVDETLTLTQVGTSAQIQGGILSGGGVISRSVVNGGFVAPGASAGLLTINQNYTQNAVGTLVTELGGLTAGTQFDRLAVVGAANINGRLHVELINDFVPAIGNEFTILTAGSVAGEFDALSGALEVDGVVLEPVYAANSVKLVAVALDGLAVSDVNVTEGSFGTTDAVFTVSLTPANGSQTVQVTVQTEDGTATVADNDYLPLGPTVLTFAPGETEKQVTVKVINDGKAEPEEYFKLVLSNGSNANLARAEGVAIIAESPEIEREDWMIVF